MIRKMSKVFNLYGKKKGFNLYGKKIEINDTYDSYNVIRSVFKIEAEDSARRFSQKYESYYGIEQFVENGYEDGMEIILEVVQREVIDKFLVVIYEIYDVDLNTFVKKYHITSTWKQRYDIIAADYQKIIRAQQQEAGYRDLRKESRGKWVGGGFGLDGAIEGAIKAGAMNMLSGVGHSVVNAAGNAISATNASSKKSDLYNKPLTKEFLCSGIFVSVLLMHNSLWTLLKDRGRKSSDSRAVPCLVSNNAESVGATVKNFPQMGNDAILNILPELFLKNPYNEDLYTALLLKFGDVNSELEEIADYFGVTNLKSTKERTLENLYQKLQSELSASEKKALVARETFSKECEFYGQTEVGEKRLSDIDAVLTDYDLKARTVDGLTMDSREKANEARNEIRQIKKLLSGLDYENSEKNAIEAKKRLEGYEAKSVIAPKYLEKLKSSLINFDEQARSVLCGGKAVIFDTREEAGKFRTMPSVQALEISYQKYLKQPEEANNLFTLMKETEIPEKIYTTYASLIGDFKKTQKETLKKTAMDLSGHKLRNLIIGNIFIVIVVGFIVTYWEQWSWFGWKTVAALFVFFGVMSIEMVFLGVMTDSPDPDLPCSAMLTHWGLIALAFSITRWNQWGWRMKGVAAFFVLIGILGVAIGISSYKDAKKAKLYLASINDVLPKPADSNSDVPE
jgi:hypothetical protein